MQFLERLAAAKTMLKYKGRVPVPFARIPQTMETHKITHDNLPGVVVASAKAGELWQLA